MKSPPASSASHDARRTLSRVASSPVSRMTFRCAGPALLLGRHDLLEHLQVAPGQERAAVDDHVDLGRAGRDRVAHVVQLGRQGRAPGRERGGHRGHLHAACRAARAPRWRRDRGRRTPPRPAAPTASDGIGVGGLRAQRAHLARRVGALERGEVDHRDRGVDGPGLGRGLDAAGGQRAARASAPTWSTPGRPCRNRRSAASSRVTSLNAELSRTVTRHRRSQRARGAPGRGRRPGSPDGAGPAGCRARRSPGRPA